MRKVEEITVCFFLLFLINWRQRLEFHWGLIFFLLLLFLRSPDIYKDTKEKTAHTEHLRDMTRRGEHSIPQMKWKNRKRGETDTVIRICLDEVEGTTPLWSRRTVFAVQHPGGWTTMGAGLGQLWPKSKLSCRCFCVSGRMRASSLVLCCAGLDWDTSILVLCWPLWLLGGGFGCCWFTVDLWWLLIGHRALSTYPQLSGATPRLWQCRRPWAVQISSSSVGAPYADLFGAGYTKR